MRGELLRALRCRCLMWAAAFARARCTEPEMCDRFLGITSMGRLTAAEISLTGSKASGRAR